MGKTMVRRLVLLALAMVIAAGAKPPDEAWSPTERRRLHEHFAEPVVVSDGHYQAPVLPGNGAEMLRPSVERWTFSSGAGWQDVLAR